MSTRLAAFLGGMAAGLVVGPPAFYLFFIHAPKPH